VDKFWRKFRWQSRFFAWFPVEYAAWFGHQAYRRFAFTGFPGSSAPNAAFALPQRDDT